MSLAEMASQIVSIAGPRALARPGDRPSVGDPLSVGVPFVLASLHSSTFISFRRNSALS